MPDILTPWHRECIERGATLLVIPVEPQPGWGEPPQRSENDPDTWFARGIGPLGNVVRIYAYCPFYSGTVVRLGDIRLRVTDVACERWDTGGELTEQYGVENIPAVFTPEVDVLDTVGFVRGLRQAYPDFQPDWHVWLVSVEREGE